MLGSVRRGSFGLLLLPEVAKPALLCQVATLILWIVFRRRWIFLQLGDGGHWVGLCVLLVLSKFFILTPSSWNGGDEICN